MPIVYRIATDDVLRLINLAACATPGTDPTLFDAHSWTDEATRTIERFCHNCTAILPCPSVVMGPATHSGFTGIAGGRVWRNGKPIRKPARRRRKPKPTTEGKPK